MKREEITLSGTQILNIPIDDACWRDSGNDHRDRRDAGGGREAREEVVLDQEVIQTIPATRSVRGLLNATAGLTVDNNGIALSPTMTFFSANGGANNEGRMAVGSMTVGAARNGSVSSYVYDAVGVKKLQSMLAAASARRTPAVRS